MGSLWSRLRHRSEGSLTTAHPVAPPERRGRSRTRTPPAFRSTKSSSDMLGAIPANTVAANTAGKNKTSRKPHEFVWKYGGNRVVLTGNFDNWTESIVMTKDHANGVFKANLNLDAHETWFFKFIVDGVWRCSLDFCTETDASGNVNNVLYPEA